MSNKPSIEREFDAFLKGEDSEIARIYRKLPQSEPDPALDAAVLAMGRSAVEPQRRAAIRHARAQHRLPAWMIGIGSAAGIVFAAGLAWQLRNSINPTPGALMRSSDNSADVINVTILPPRDPKAATMPPLPEPVAKPVASATAPPPPPALAAEAKEQRADAQSFGYAKQESHGVTEYTLPSGAAGRRPQPAPFVRDAPPAEQEIAQAQAQEAGAAAADDKAADDTYEPEDQPGWRGAPRQDELARRRERTAAAKGKPGADLRENDVAANAAAPAATAAGAPSAGLRSSAQPAKPDQSRANIAHEEGKLAKDKLMPVNTAGLQRNAKLPPVKWIAKIRELLAAGKRDEAIDNAQYFRAKYPGYAMPDEIRQLADEDR